MKTAFYFSTMMASVLIATSVMFMTNFSPAGAFMGAGVWFFLSAFRALKNEK